jgi:hypothetical protein
VKALILLAIVATISILISVTSNWLRAQQRKLEEDAARRRAKSRPVTASAGKAGASDIDRFLEEINKLRQKPVAEVAPKRAEPVRPPVVARPLPPPPPPAPSRFEDRPAAAPVVVPPPPVAVARPVVAKSSARTAPETPFGRQLAGLLSDPKSIPMAVVLTEILGPPKCRRPGPDVRTG